MNTSLTREYIGATLSLPTSGEGHVHRVNARNGAGRCANTVVLGPAALFESGENMGYEMQRDTAGLSAILGVLGIAMGTRKDISVPEKKDGE